MATTVPNNVVAMNMCVYRNYVNSNVPWGLISVNMSNVSPLGSNLSLRILI